MFFCPHQQTRAFIALGITARGLFCNGVASFAPPAVQVQQSAKIFGQQFVESIMGDYESIPDSNGMFALRHVVDLETMDRRDIVIRKITEQFWQACISLVDTPKKRFRVCAVGTPGIGKSTSTAILIRMLLKKKQTVVYNIRTDEKDEWFYEFTPSATTDATIVKVYPQTMSPVEIPSLRKQSTYYVVDPGKTKSNCDPSDAFQAKVILVSSPDNEHWGKFEFAKQRGTVLGFFKFFPLWSLEELLSASSILDPTLTEEQIRERYRQVGGVPRHVFACPNAAYETILLRQAESLAALTADDAFHMARGNMGAVESMSSSQPRPSLMGITASCDDLFDGKTASVISALVEERLYGKFISTIWYTMFGRGEDGWKIFEAYTRGLVALDEGKTFPSRAFGGELPYDKFTNKYTKKLGWCSKETRLVLDSLSAAKAIPNVLFYSLERTHGLIDFVYQDDGHYYAFQASAGRNRAADPGNIMALQQKVGGGENLSLYYLVASYELVGPNPDVNPNNTDGITCGIHYLLIFGP
jgi:hypothetical protein